jgi:4-diphosphocytidyl-2-C-methyl-D-erythritol kinase
MDNIDLVAHAKINLTLDVLAKREDGYHEVEMIMQTIDLHDRISFTKIDTGIEIVSNHPEVPTDKSNLIYKAAELLFKDFKLEGGLRVNLDKRIPVAAGLAGGSSNAAATLVAINRLWDLRLTSEQLAKIGGRLGADIPFCIKGGTQLATGIGTDLKKLTKCPQLYLILVNPSLLVSTAKVYGSLNLEQAGKHPSTDEVIRALEEQDRGFIIENLSNLLESVTLKIHPEVAELKNKVAKLSNKALMSGSGPTILGFVSAIEEAESIKSKLEKELPREYRVVVTKTIDQGIVEI